MIDIGCCGTTHTYLAIKNMGYDYIELSGRQIMSLSDAEFEDFLQLYKKIGFPCRGFNDYCGAQTPIVGEGSGSQAVLEYAEKICRRGGALGIKTIGIGAPSARTLPEGYLMEQADKEMAAFLKMICPIAAEYGITILLEAVHAHMCNYLTLTPQAAKMVQNLAIPNLAMVLDYYHAMVMGEDLHSLTEFIPLVRHLHFSTDLENHARGYVRDEDIPLLRQLLSEAANAGYTGGISIEAAADKLASDGMACCRRMRETVKNIN